VLGIKPLPYLVRAFYIDTAFRTTPRLCLHWRKASKGPRRLADADIAGCDVARTPGEVYGPVRGAEISR
jgi:hypothetical protein